MCICIYFGSRVISLWIITLISYCWFFTFYFCQFWSYTHNVHMRWVLKMDSFHEVYFLQESFHKCTIKAQLFIHVKQRITANGSLRYQTKYWKKKKIGSQRYIVRLNDIITCFNILNYKDTINYFIIKPLYILDNIETRNN